jgi:glycosyltransferase involved in cell wall biosynthesis
MKVLMSAYACEPGRGTEPGVGWNTVWEVAKYHEVWVLTRPDDGREAIEAELGRNPQPNLHFVYFTLPLIGSIWKLGVGAFQIHYYLWQLRAYWVGRNLHREIGFDLVHHVTFVKYSNPSFLAFLPIPFIWGPVGGGESAPKAFWKDFSRRGMLYEVFRNFSRWLGERDPFTWLTARRSCLIRATTEETRQRLLQIGASNVEVYSQVGLLSEEIARLAQYPITSTSTVKFIGIGRLLHWKGFHLSIRAFAKANLPNAEYWIVGDGSERGHLQALAEALGVSHQVKFWNELPREKVFHLLEECQVMVHPSLHESGGFVCLEAMAAGRPVICLDLGGPAVQVTEATGFKVAAHNPEQAIEGLAIAMTQLANDSALRIRMGQAGREMVLSFYDWTAKGQQLAQLYETILTQQRP